MQIAAQSLSLSASSLHYRSEQEKLSLSSPSTAASKGVNEVCETSGEDPLEGVDPKYRMMALMLEALTGQKITLAAFRTNAAAAGTLASASSGGTPSNSPILEYQYQMQELNRMSFSAEGKAVLEDGSVREFSLSIEWTQSFSESVRLRIQDGKILTDPLVISFDGSQPLSTNAFAFNLTGKEGQSLPYLSGRAGYLALDADHDGKITQGSELFGPRTGEGFMELAAHDDDRNGWIDAGDDVFKQLRVWMVSEGGENLLSLQEAGIGAISLKTASIDYAFKSDADTTIAQYKKASVALGETAGAFGVFEVDVAV